MDNKVRWSVPVSVFEGSGGRTTFESGQTIKYIRPEKFSAFECRNVLKGLHAEKQTIRYCHTATIVIPKSFFVSTLCLCPLDHGQPEIDAALETPIDQKVEDSLLIGRIIVLPRKT
jgi:hypothetical protein